MRLSPDFLLNFPGCTAAPVSAIAVMVPPWKPKEGRKEKWRGRNITINHFPKTSSVPRAPAMERISVGRTRSSLWRLCTIKLHWDLLLLLWTLRDQDDPLAAASSVHLGGTWSSRLRPFQWTASCSTHSWRHHHRSLVLRPSPASCWQGNLCFWACAHLQDCLWVI